LSIARSNPVTRNQEPENHANRTTRTVPPIATRCSQENFIPVPYNRRRTEIARSSVVPPLNVSLKPANNRSAAKRQITARTKSRRTQGSGLAVATGASGTFQDGDKPDKGPRMRRILFIIDSITGRTASGPDRA